MDPIEPMQEPVNIKAPKKGIPVVSAIFIVLLVAVIAFVAGVRFDESGLLSTTTNPSNSTLPEDLDYSSVEDVYDVLRREFDGTLTEQEILDGIKSGLAQATNDPYTVYLNSDQAKQFNDDLNGTFTGIGAEIGKENDVLIVVSPLDGFPAAEAGLRAKDAIIKIDDEETFGYSIEEAVLKIRGEEGTDVTLTVLRDNEQLEITITRAKIVIPSVESEMLENNIGYIRISRFAEDTVELARAAAQDFKDRNVKGVVLDLRNNSGGFLSSAVDVSSIWVDGLPVVEQRENEGQLVTDSLKAGSGHILGDTPTVLLINEGSASASEIVAGALQDYDKAILVGQTSFGKGSVQSLEKLGGGAQLKVTIARWYTPNGSNIDEMGISPDEVVEVTERDIEKEVDTQRNRAIVILKEQ